MKKDFEELVNILKEYAKNQDVLAKPQWIRTF